MRFPSCLVVGLSLVIVASAGVVSLQRPALFGGPGGADAGHRSCEMVPADPVITSRLQARTGVTTRLIDGQLTLLEAAAWFQYIDEVLPSPGNCIPPEDESVSEAEQYCRQAIRWAGGQMEQRSRSQAAVLVRRLQAELDGRLRRHGRIELPAFE